MSGLSSSEAVQKLCNEITSIVDEHEQILQKTCFKRFVSQMLCRSSRYTPISFFSVLGMAVALLVAASMEEVDKFSSGSRAWLVVEAVLLILSIAFNCLLICLRIKRNTAKDIGLKKAFIKILQDAVTNSTWSSENYPHLHTPMSPCISLQWCMRDKMLVNLPHTLLVAGDVIMLRPGHPAPEHCQAVEGDMVLKSGEIYFSEMHQESGEGPQPRKPLVPKKFVLKETPIIKNIKSMFEENPSKPLSFLENERYTVCNVWLEQRFLPVTFLLFLAINVSRYLYLEKGGGHWTELILVLQVHGALPLVPVLLPFLWTVVNIFGQAHIFAAYDIFRSLKDFKDSTESLGSCSNISVKDADISISWPETLSRFWDMFWAKRPIICPDFEMLHALGSVTALCCVDKKGILSWPNPSAEKVFFFSSASKQEFHEDDEDDKNDKDEKKVIKRRRRHKTPSDSDPSSNIEVLDMTHDAAKLRDAFGVLFDDPNWKNHLSALKPLGLNILLNTCNPCTSEWYTQFTDHVSCAAREKKDTVAVINRRCLCLLPREIGFVDDAVNIFTHEATLGVYRQVPHEEAEREKQNRARSFIQHKIPMPNQVSVVVRDKLTGMCQLMTQGTGDLVLDCCTDAWNGTDLQTLTEMDRKRVLDFYHRNSMIAYCTAFAYKPLPKSVEEWSSDVYTELMETPSTTKVAHGEDMGVFLDGDEEIQRHPRSHSVDSLLEMSPTTSMEELGLGKMLQSHQTFIGMVSLQYQARQDFVQLIDKLESACIRFVHFSKENEVRSRVFAEKMGLEAGWNCHVSLMAAESVASENSSSRNLSSLCNNVQGEAADGPMSETGSNPQGLIRSRDLTTGSLCVTNPMFVPRTQSAPSFVNTQEVQVKFAKDTLPMVPDHDSVTEDSILLTDVGSTICGKGNYDEQDGDETSALLKEAALTEQNKNDNEVENNSELEDEDKRRLVPRRGHKSWAESEYEDEDDEEDFDVQSDSRYTSSYVTENTEDSLTGALDNRAHLPRGIENIRPHLQNIDNVPLLVNLFTDCVPEATCEMVKIMQENGEVVLVVGSSLNIVNTPVFMQADSSIAIEPLFPQLCARHPVMTYPWNEDEPTPIELSSRILSLPCCLFFQRGDNITLVQLIMESRHYIFAMRNCFYLMLCCLLAVVLSQFVCCLFLLPPVMDVQHVLWLVLVVVPALSLSLLGNPNEARTVGLATHKNIHHVNKQMIIEFVLQFCTRFLPSIIIAVLSFALVLHSFCENVSTVHCSIYEIRYDANSSNITSWSQKFQGGLVLAQNIFHLYFVIFLVAISMSLVHWQDHLWQRLPFKNLVWSLTAGILLATQIVFCVADVYMRHNTFGSALPLSDVVPAVWVIGCVWPLITISLNELAKKREIKLAVRRQRRARLDFDTKLGMNSPF
ncbi:transmembrane protein 94-like [Physella acuta]|uniref:transmembrane protein 94-like n=1 Tax=Physella acuta TaxID=109671 RepID=UPI0027DD6FEF|nr:transmembrane protein 94-like [Physella acuta]